MRSTARLGFAGSPPFAATVLAALREAYPIQVVYCQAPKPTGRGRRLTPCAVHTLADAHRIEVRTPRSLRGAEAAGALADLQLDYLIVAAYGLILPPAVLAAPRYGCLNVHASLLPRWRGAAPIERALMAGDRVTGVCIMQMDAGLDTGPVLRAAPCPIAEDDTGGSLHAKLARIGAATLLECLGAEPPLTGTAQDDATATYAAKLTAADALIDWRADAIAIARQVRALTERMPALTHLRGERIRVLAATADAVGAEAGSAVPGTVLSYDAKGLAIACGQGVLRVSRLQLSRGKGTPMPVAAAFNGYPDLAHSGEQCDAPA